VLTLKKEYPPILTRFEDQITIYRRRKRRRRRRRRSDVDSCS
jgi:hypothetical protein